MTKKSAARNSIIYTLGNFIPPAMNVFLLPVFTQLLSPRDFGIFTYTTAISALITTMTSLSIHEYLLRHYFECRTDDERRSLFGTLFGFVILVNGGFLALELIVLPPLFRAAHVHVPFHPYVQLMLLATAIEVVGVIPLAYFRVREEAGRYVVLFGGQTVLNLSLSLYLVLGRHMGLLGRYYGVLWADVVFFGIYLVIMVRVSRVRWDPGLVRRALAFSVPLLPAGLLWSATTISDRFVLERYVSLSQLGLYAIGFSLGFALYALVNGVLKAIEPQLYRAASEGRLDEQAKQIHKVVLAVMILCGALVVAMSREIVQVLTAQPFRSSYQIVVLIVVSVVVQGVAVTSLVYTMAIKQTKAIPLVTLAGATTSLIVNLILVPQIGIYGSGVASIASSLAILLGYKVVNERVTQLRWPVTRDLAIVAIALGASYLLMEIRLPMFVSVPLKVAVVGGVAALLVPKLVARVRLGDGASPWPPVGS